MTSKRTRTELTLERKYEIVSYAETHPNLKNIEIANHFSMKEHTLSDTVKMVSKLKKTTTAIHCS